MKGKRGFQLTINTLVIMVLAMVLLIFLIMFFMKSSGGFVETIKGYFSYSNVDSVVNGCNILVDSGQEHAFCCEKKQVKYYLDGKKMDGEFSCGELIREGFVENRIDSGIDCGGVGC